MTARYYMRRQRPTTPDPFLSQERTKAGTEGTTLSHNWAPSATFSVGEPVTLTHFKIPSGVDVTVDPLNIDGTGVGFPSALIDNAYYPSPHFPRSRSTSTRACRRPRAAPRRARPTRNGRSVASERRSATTASSSAASTGSSSTVSSSRATRRADFNFSQTYTAQRRARRLRRRAMATTWRPCSSTGRTMEAVNADVLTEVPPSTNNRRRPASSFRTTGG